MSAVVTGTLGVEGAGCEAAGCGTGADAGVVDGTGVGVGVGTGVGVGAGVVLVLMLVGAAVVVVGVVIGSGDRSMVDVGALGFGAETGARPLVDDDADDGGGALDFGVFDENALEIDSVNFEREKDEEDEEEKEENDKNPLTLALSGAASIILALDREPEYES